MGSSDTNFVPLFMKCSVSPALVRPGYRVGEVAQECDHAPDVIFRGGGDICPKISTRLMLERVGTVVSMMLPYMAVLNIVWSILLVLGYMLSIPFGI